MTTTRTLFGAMALVTAIYARQTDAQCIGVNSCNTTNTVSVTVGALVALDLSSTSTTLTNPTATDITAASVIADPGPTLTIRANRSWTLNVRSQNPTNWDYVGTEGGVKPIGDLSWSTTAGGTFTAVTNADAIFTSGATATAGTIEQAFFRISWAGGFGAPSNAPGTYTLPLIFTLTAP
jgi:hypothetical protein